MSSLRESSVIIPTRGEGDRLEVFWSRRQPHLRFLGGFHAFFGGSVEPEDRAIPGANLGDQAPSFLGCAARELFEEGGLLVTSEGLFHSAAHNDRFTDLAAARDHLLAGEIDLAHWLAEHGLRIDASRFSHLGRWVTPEFSEIRFDSHFYVVDLTGAELEHLQADAFGDHLFETELHRGEWVQPRDALSRWRAGELFISPPIRFALDALRDAHRGSTARADQADQTDLVGFAEATGGIYLVPLESPTIPPATHTNCYIVGDERMVMIDPGSPHASENEILFDIVERLLAGGRSLEAVVLTHHHIDHVAGVSQVLQRWNVPVWAHRRTAESLDKTWSIDRFIEHGDRIDLGPDSLEVLHTPGHASGHVAFTHGRTNTAIVGDLVATFGTILVNPPDGHMGDYLESLERLREIAPGALFPAHGWVVSEADAHLEFYIRHRLQREAKVLAALKRFGKPATAADLVPDAYDDAPKKVWPIAARSAEAHLIHLVEIGAATREGAHFSLRG
jgi:glyoxylase-like metal-dependent hydrolase (beta-lactamase superfamily II)/8-oxo-dGTP pyrophosphatase MutT (NUDIX family)